MATGSVYKVRYHSQETVTAGGAFVKNYNTDQQVLVAGTTLAAALALVPAAPAVVSGHSGANVIDNIHSIADGAVLS